MKTFDEISSLFSRHGGGAYFGEVLTQLDHALQAAHFAAADGAADELVVAALLHDVGHLLQATPDDLADWHTDARHEVEGATWLAKRFPREISEPVRLHVPAKRYLCATDPAYRAVLSEASIVTLKLQGGPMSAAQVAQFEMEPFHTQALQVRRCDDRGKMAGLKVRGLADYRLLVQRFAPA